MKRVSPLTQFLMLQAALSVPERPLRARLKPEPPPEPFVSPREWQPPDAGPAYKWLDKPRRRTPAQDRRRKRNRAAKASRRRNR